MPKWNEMFGPTIRALTALGGSGTIQEINEQVTANEGYSSEQQAVQHGNGRQSKIEYRLAWARTNLKNLGAVTNSRRGVWVLTDFGRTATEEELIARDREWRRGLAAERARRAEAIAPKKEDDGDGAAEEDESDWTDQVLQCLLDIAPDAFERLAQRLLREAGFVNVHVTGRSGDGGIDGTGIYRLSPLVKLSSLLPVQALSRQRVPWACARFSRGDGGSRR